MKDKTVFLFPGQGSQRVGMLADFAEQPSVKETFAEASDILSLDVWKLVRKGPESELNKTICTQPALLTCSVALWRLWCAEKGPAPDFMAGHSLGEYSALVCADSLAFDKTLVLVRQRGKYMQMAVSDKKSTMAAILGLQLETVQKLCEATASIGYVQPANINSETQIVISGFANAVEAVCKKAKTEGAKRTVLLPVSVASHCELMRSAADLLAEDIHTLEIKPPRVPVFHNTCAAVAEKPEQVREFLVKQLVSPVRWFDTVKVLREKGAGIALECGPGRVLGGLNRFAGKEIQNFHLGEKLVDFETALETLRKLDQ